MSEQNLLKALSPETQKLIYAELELNQAKLMKENQRLLALLRQKEDVLNTLTSEGLNIAHLGSIHDCAKTIGLPPEQLMSLREQGRHDEFLKMVYRKYHHDMEQLYPLSANSEVDKDGVFMHEKLKDAVDFFFAHRDARSSYSNEDIDVHMKMADSLKEAFDMVLNWTKIEKQVNAEREAVIDLTMWYGVESLKANAEKKRSVVEEYKAPEEEPEEDDGEPVPMKARAAPAPPPASKQEETIKALKDEIMQIKTVIGSKPVQAPEEPPEEAEEAPENEPADMPAPAPVEEEPKKKRKY